MDRDKAIDTVLGAILSKGQEEVTALIGQPVEFSDTKVTKSTREDLFNGLQDLQVLAELKVEGDREGTAFLLCPLADALTLGGALIMLPEEELQERISKAEFGPDEADAFGEIVNILAGVISGLFDEYFPDSLRFVKTEQQLINPLDVVAKDEYPMPVGTIFLATGSGTLQSKPLSGKVQIVVPADILGLDQSAVDSPADSVPSSVDEEPGGSPASKPTGDDEAADSQHSVETGSMDETQTEKQTEDAGNATSESVADSGGAALENNPASSIDEQKLVKLLKVVHTKVREEVGGFLGRTLEINNEKFVQVKRKELFEDLEGTQVLARMRVEGDREGESCLLTNLGTAIHLGGTLIMLPDSELQERLKSGEYGAEDSDAFGEIVNIVAGIYSAVFNDLYPGNLRFVKTEQESIDPLVIKSKEEYPVNDGDFFLASGDAVLNAVDLGRISVFIPVEVLGLKNEAGAASGEKPVNAESGTSSVDSPDANAEQDESSEISENGSKPSDASNSSQTVNPASPHSDESSNAQSIILVCGDSEEQANVFLKAIEGLDCVARFQNVQDNVGGYGPETRGVFLVLGDVGEQGIAAAIKINASIQGRMPLIAAGPNWTKSMVLRAIKYGIQDILVTPASEAQIQAKVKLHLVA